MFRIMRSGALPWVATLAVGMTATAAAQQASRAGRLEVLLTTAPTLSEAARNAMTNEAEEIWRQQGIALDWLPAASVRTPSPDRLRVLVVAERTPGSASGLEFSVGELIRPSGSHPVALVSVASARRLVSSLRGRKGYELIAVDERRLGVVLGRALAHEIGHYLLDTHTHAQSGLMRPQFSAFEFTDHRDGIFALDAAAAAWLQRRDVSKFAYAHR
jgi:hypothetical protein